MKTLDTIDFKGKRALVRVDFNVPLDKSYRITDDNRIRGALPTLKKILSAGGSIVLMSHLGRPLKKLKEDGSVDFEKFTLRHVVDRTSELLGAVVHFAGDCIGDESFRMSGSMKPGDVILLENLRFYKEEEKGDPAFASQLAAHGDIYVNDAFGTAHRAHASTSIIASHFPDAKCFGYLMQAELENAKRVMENAGRPFTAVMGGAKVSDKILIIENLIGRADNIIIGGGMAYTFFKAMGGKIGDSLVEEDKLQLASDLMKKAKEKGCNLILPADSVLGDKFDKDANLSLADNLRIPEGWMGLDIGPTAIRDFTEAIRSSKTILWNGPMGVFEMDKFAAGTRAVAQSIAATTTDGAYSLIGGGDSAAAINAFGLADKVSYVSTGGGALLEYFEGKELPGVMAILN
ncbi:MAG: phosphoglycerate kinase [Bacteroidota bacterium]